MDIQLDLRRIEDYRRFLKIKALPSFSFQGRVASFPDEYADQINEMKAVRSHAKYRPIPGLFDYQKDIAALAIKKQKFAVFADCGLGKTLILLEFARHAAAVLGPTRRVLIVSPLMVVGQTIEAVKQFYRDKGINDLGVEQVKANRLSAWMTEVGSFIGITNYEALSDETPQGRLGALILDESSLLKSHYGKHGQQCLRLGAGLDWKLCCSGTPAPNDRIEYANHAVFLDHYPTVNSFLARFFVNRGQTSERWELKPHAIEPFYRALSHWSDGRITPKAFHRFTFTLTTWT
jgi:hypothetical protein